MTEKELKEYQSLCQEIKSLDERIRKEQEKEIDIVAGKVKASMPEFPYTEIRVGVQMENPEQAEASREILQIYQERKAQAEKKKLEIEKYIGSIGDSHLRLIFQYRYIDGLKQQEVARKVNLDRSRVSRKISNYLKNAHKAQKNVV